MSKSLLHVRGALVQGLLVLALTSLSAIAVLAMAGVAAVDGLARHERVGVCSRDLRLTPPVQIVGIVDIVAAKNGPAASAAWRYAATRGVKGMGRGGRGGEQGQETRQAAGGGRGQELVCPAPGGSCCSGGARCSREWGAEKGSRKKRPEC